MSLHQFQSQFEGDDPLRTQRLTADESRAVIALWQQERVEQTGLTDRPAIPDVAEGLDVPIEEVQRLLAEVRARRVKQEQALAKEQVKNHIAQEEHRLAEIGRLRAGIRQGQANPQRRTRLRRHWMEVRPGVWEDVNQQGPRVSFRTKVGLIVVCLIFSTVATLLACLLWLLRFASPQLTQ